RDGAPRALLRALRSGVRRREPGAGGRTQRRRAGPRGEARPRRAVHGERRGRGRADPRCRRRRAGAIRRGAGARGAPAARGSGGGARDGRSRTGSHRRRRGGARAAPGAHRSAPRARRDATRGHRVMGGLATAVERAWVPRTGSDRALRALLVPASAAYGVAVAVRNALYDGGWLAVTRGPARVVSVGNPPVGGTGKTPAALWLADALSRRGRRVALVARGYRKRRPGVVVVGADGVPLVSPQDGGDEAVMLARRFRGPVVTGERRADAAAAACARFAVDTLVLDDGFQHRALARDADLVLLADDPAARRLLPAGSRREPLGSLARARAAL